jgi:hypothetical protein
MKKWMLRFGLMMAVTTASYAVTMESLGQEKIKKLLENHTMTTVSMITLNGKMVNNTFTGYLSRDGKIVGQLADKPGAARQGDKGTWTVTANGLFCVKWEKWQDAKETCANVYETKNMLIFVDATTGKFESAVPLEHVKEGDQMN